VTDFTIVRRGIGAASAMQNDAIGPPRHFAATQQFGRFRTEADVGRVFECTLFPLARSWEVSWNVSTAARKQ
jgi:hypothetical protein